MADSITADIQGNQESIGMIGDHLYPGRLDITAGYQRINRPVLNKTRAFNESGV